jgi:hypothetical protein
MTPSGGAHFDPRDVIWTNLVDFYKKMFNAKYLRSSSLGFLKYDFYVFTIYI